MGKQYQFEAVEHLIGTTSWTLDYILEQGKDADKLIALYMFYRKTAAWQSMRWNKPDNRPKATNNYVAKGLCWSIGKLEKYKAKLIELQLIKNIKLGPKQDYIQIYTAHPTSPKTEEVNHPKKRPTSTIHNNTKTSAGFLSGGKQKKNPYKQLATQFHLTLAKKNIARIFNATWTNSIRLLIEKDGWDFEEVQKVAVWYPKVIRDKFMPKAYTAKQFREKYPTIRQQYLIKEQGVIQTKKHAEGILKVLTGLKNFRLPAYARDELPDVVAESYHNMKRFWVKWKQVMKTTRAMHTKELLRPVQRSDKTAPYKKVKLLSGRLAIQPFLISYFKHKLTNLQNWDAWNGHITNQVMTEGPELAAWLSKRLGKNVTWKELEKLIHRYSDNEDCDDL